MKIILASLSPRRHEILNLVKIPHEVVPSHSQEKVQSMSNPEEMVLEISYQKASEIAKLYPRDIVIGADTMVVIDDTILGKPKNKEESIKMLTMLSGRTHQVLTGVCVIANGKVIKFVEKSDVTFYDLREDEILNYINNDVVYDKAGSYAIQSMCAKYIKEIRGDYYNIVGLPIGKLYHILKQENLLK